MTMVPWVIIASVLSRGKGVVVLWHVNEYGFVNMTIKQHS